MHEASIAQQILHVAKEHTADLDPESIESVHVKIGEFSGVLTDSVHFCFDVMIAGTDWQHVRLVIDRTPFLVRCHTCQNTARNELGIALCAQCGSSDTEILSGYEMAITEIQLKENVT